MTDLVYAERTGHNYGLIRRWVNRKETQSGLPGSDRPPIVVVNSPLVRQHASVPDFFVLQH